MVAETWCSREGGGYKVLVLEFLCLGAKTGHINIPFSSFSVILKNIFTKQPFFSCSIVSKNNYLYPQFFPNSLKHCDAQPQRFGFQVCTQYEQTHIGLGVIGFSVDFCSALIVGWFAR